MGRAAAWPMVARAARAARAKAVRADAIVDVGVVVLASDRRWGLSMGARVLWREGVVGSRGA